MNRLVSRLGAIAAVVAALGIGGATLGASAAGASVAAPDLPSNCWEAGWYDQYVNGIAGFCYNSHTGYVDWYGFNGEYGTSYQHQ